MKPTRRNLVLSWLIVGAAVVLAWLVHESLFGVAIAALILRPDLQDKEQNTALISRYGKLVVVSSIYAALASIAILSITVLSDKALGSALGVSSIFILFWPLIILVCLHERQLFINATPSHT